MMSRHKIGSGVLSFSLAGFSIIVIVIGLLLYGNMRTFAVSPAGGGFPLPIPRGIDVTSLDELRGVLIATSHGDFQIDEMTWMITADGTLEIHAFTGYDESGELVEASHGEHEGREVTSLDDLSDFVIWTGSSQVPIFHVEAIGYATTSDGFLSVRSLAGTDLFTGATVYQYWGPADYCHPVWFDYCWNIDCNTCNPKPTCGCADPPWGMCPARSGIQDCVGDCPPGQTCKWFQGPYCACAGSSPVEEHTWGAIKELFEND